MSYIDENNLYLTRAYLLQKAKLHALKFDELKDTKDIDLGNGSFQSDVHLNSNYEYMDKYGYVCEVVTKMQRVENHRVKLSKKIKR